MSYLILVRHGQSVWNLEKKFTGWVDVDLTENGKSEAKKAGELIKQEKIEVNMKKSVTGFVKCKDCAPIDKFFRDWKKIWV